MQRSAIKTETMPDMVRRSALGEAESSQNGSMHENSHGGKGYGKDRQLFNVGVIHFGTQ